ncbi:MAG: CPBP family intramembrane glutamic endopeptidase, partial [Oscillospiraceae bacterium]
AIWMAAFAFSMFHMQFYGLIPRMLLGAYFGYLLVWTRSLWIPIIAHFANNAIALLQIWLQQRGTDPQTWFENNLPVQSWIWGATSLILFALTATLIRRRN